jgi:ABC-2 type transport system permease protein
VVPAPAVAIAPAPWPHYVGIILRARLRAGLRRWRRRRFGLAVLLVLLVVAAAAAVGLGTAGLGLGRALRLAGPELSAQLTGQGVSVAALPMVVPSVVFLVGWLGLFFLSFASLLGTLYLRRDLPGLLVAPVPMRAVFTAQFLEALTVPLLWTCVLALPVLWGFGRGLGLGAGYFAVSAVCVALLPLVPLGLAAAATLVLLRLVPAPRAAEILTLLGTLFGVGIWVFSQSLGSMAERFDSTGPALLQRSTGLASPAWPWAWAARAMLAAGTGHWLLVLAFGTLFAGLSLGTFAACVVLAERVYYDGWVQGGESRRRERRRTTPRRPSAEVLARVLPRPAVAIARKDWRLMRRDPRGYSALIWIGAILLFWTWRWRQARGDPGLELMGLAAQPAVGAVTSLAPVALALLFSGMRWGLESVSRDQHTFQIVQAAPVSGRHVALGKWLGAVVPSLALALVVLGVASAATGQLAPAVLLRNGLVLLPILAAETAVMVAFGAARPNFDWSDPKQMAGGLTGCLGQLAAWVYVGVSLLLVATGLALAALAGLPAAVGLVGWAAASALALAVAWAALTFAAERLANVEL